MRIKLTNSDLSHQVGETIGIGVCTDPEKKPEQVQVVSVIIRHWNYKDGLVLLAFARQDAPNQVWAGYIAPGVRYGEVTEYVGVVSLKRDNGKLTVFGQNNSVLACLGGQIESQVQ